jgi:hypothetical protein
MIRRGSEVRAIAIGKGTRSEVEFTRRMGCGVVNLVASRNQPYSQSTEFEYAKCLCSSCTDFVVHGLEVGPQLSTQSSNEYCGEIDTRDFWQTERGSKMDTRMGRKWIVFTVGEVSRLTHFNDEYSFGRLILREMGKTATALHMALVSSRKVFGRQACSCFLVSVDSCAAEAR